MKQISTNNAALKTMVLFFLQPIALAGWLAVIPKVQADIGLNKAELAMALLGLPVALMISLNAAGPLLARFGARKVMAVAFPLNAIAAIGPVLANSQATLTIALVLWGSVLGFLQVGLNAYAGRLEKQAGTSIMQRSHGFWALGLMAGPVLMGLWPDWPLPTKMAFQTLPVAAVCAIVALGLPHLGAPPGSKGPPRRRLRDLPAPLLIISAFVFPIAMTEGAVADWGAVFLAEHPDIGALRVGVGISIYAGFMAFGRFIGDGLKIRFGSVLLARVTIASALAGFCLLAISHSLMLALVGFALIGFGVSVGFPLAVSAVSELDDLYEGANIAIMTMLAMISFMVGPVLIGFISEATSLRFGLAILIPGLALSFWLAGRLSPTSARATISTSR